MFSDVHLKNFGPFSDFRWSEHGRVNVVVGENDTGKSYLLRAMYAIAKSIEMVATRKAEHTGADGVSRDKLRWTFQSSPDLSALVRNGAATLEVETQFAGCAYRFESPESAPRIGSPVAPSIHSMERGRTPSSCRRRTLLDECIQKATDCLLVLASVWHDLPVGQHLAECIPEEWRARPADAVRLRLTFVVKTSAPVDHEALNTLQARLRDKLGGRLELLQLRDRTTVFLLDHRGAERAGVPISTFDEEPAGRRRRGR